MTNILKSILRPIYKSAAFTPLRAARQSADNFNRYYRKRVVSVFVTTFRRPSEISNFTYDITPRNLVELTHSVAIATNKPVNEIRGYIDEIRGDGELRNVLHERLKSRGNHGDLIGNPFGRRAGWYAFVRALKPQIIVETGVDRGLGALALCAGLLRNAAEGKAGRYYGTDINPDAGWLLAGKYAQVGKILYGDSITSLARLGETIDLFINDSDHSAEYEYREYETITSKLSSRAVILGDNSHTNAGLARYSEARGRHYLFFREEPADHWYPGGGIGISFPAKQVTA